MTDLSPGAQAVKDAVIALYTDQQQIRDWGWRLDAPTVAAALRVAACQIKPHISRTPWLTNDDGYFNETFETCVALGELTGSEILLAIAAELEGGND